MTCSDSAVNAPPPGSAGGGCGDRAEVGAAASGGRCGGLPVGRARHRHREGALDDLPGALLHGHQHLLEVYTAATPTAPELMTEPAQLELYSTLVWLTSWSS